MASCIRFHIKRQRYTAVTRVTRKNKCEFIFPTYIYDSREGLWSILNFHFRTDKKPTWLVHVIIKYAKQYLRARRSTTPYMSYTPLHYTILYTPVLLLYTYTKNLARIVTESINRKRIRKKAPMGQAVTAAVVKVRVNKLRS